MQTSPTGTERNTSKKIFYKVMEREDETGSPFIHFASSIKDRRDSIFEVLILMAKEEGLTEEEFNKRFWIEDGVE